MARPKRGNYATGAEGQARYRKAVTEYLKKQKAAREKKTEITSTKKNIAKQKATNKKAATTTKEKTTAKSKTTTKPKSTAAKGKSLATGKTSKPTTTAATTTTTTRRKTTTKPKTTAANLKIKKAANTTRQALKKAAPKVKKAVKTVAKKAGEAKKTVTKKASQLKQVLKKGKAPAPKTPAQKVVSKAYRGAKKSISTRGKDALKIAKKAIKNPKSAIKGGVGGALVPIAGHVINTRVDREFAKRKGMTLQEFNAAKKKMKDNRNIVRSAKNIVNKVRGKSGESSTTKNINKQKKANTTPNRGLKIKKTERSSRKNTNKDYNALTATKKADKRFATFREGDDANLKLQLERQDGNKETYSRKLSKESEKTKKAPVTTKTKTKKGFIRDPQKKGRLYSARSAQGRKLANKLKARERAKEMARKNKKKKKV